MDYEPQVSGFQFLIPSKNNIDGWTKCWTPPPLFPWCGGLTSKAQKCESIFYSLTTFRHSFSNVEMFASIVLGCSKKKDTTKVVSFFLVSVSNLWCSGSAKPHQRQGFRPWRKHLYGAPAPPHRVGPHVLLKSISIFYNNVRSTCSNKCSFFFFRYKKWECPPSWHSSPYRQFRQTHGYNRPHIFHCYPPNSDCASTYIHSDTPFVNIPLYPPAPKPCDSVLPPPHPTPALDSHMVRP